MCIPLGIQPKRNEKHPTQKKGRAPKPKQKRKGNRNTNGPKHPKTKCATRKFQESEEAKSCHTPRIRRRCKGDVTQVGNSVNYQATASIDTFLRIPEFAKLRHALVKAVWRRLAIQWTIKLLPPLTLCWEFFFSKEANSLKVKKRVNFSNKPLTLASKAVIYDVMVCRFAEPHLIRLKLLKLLSLISSSIWDRQLSRRDRDTTDKRTDKERRKREKRGKTNNRVTLCWEFRSLRHSGMHS